MGRRKKPHDEFSGGKCDDCWNYSDSLFPSDDGLMKCDCCMMLGGFTKAQRLGCPQPVQTEVLEYGTRLSLRVLVEVAIVCETRSN